ncbi:hypothetical protein SASPL_154279 [Salvia splendens]|uniref:Uncharacterized protein n=1 Tax=Salvia splendens TaxID=180675 RepID=A0A8X8VZW6_SALSN|nr:hypothetical protein SASPL_154279 [Salvia splendens]
MFELIQNSPFYNNRNLLAKAKVLAARKDIDAVKELSNTELSKDGRLRNFDEKPLVVVERPVLSEAEVVKTKVKETPKKTVKEYEQEAPPVEKPHKDARQVLVDEKKIKELKRLPSEHEKRAGEEEEWRRRCCWWRLSEAVAEDAEPEKVEEKVEVAVAQKSKEHGVRLRGRARADTETQEGDKLLDVGCSCGGVSGGFGFGDWL